MADKEAIKKATETEYRRSSLTDKSTGLEVIESSRIEGILGKMGQSYNSTELQAFIKKLDPMDSGFLNHDAYRKICDKFVQNPAIVANLDSDTDQFAFKQLIRPGDF